MQQRFEQYLDSLEKPLNTLSPDERREWRHEAAQHLGDLAAAHEELGATPEEAAEAALAQFGDAGLIGSQMRQQASGRILDGSGWQAAARAVLLLFAPVCVGHTVLAALSAVYIRGGPVTYQHLGTAAAIVFLFAPLAGGWLVGRRLPRWEVSARGQRRTRRDHAPWPWQRRMPDSDFLPWLLVATFFYLMMGSVLSVFGQVAGPVQLEWGYGFLWLPMATAAAWAGSRWTRARLRRNGRATT
jgi:hypothetical protein